MWRFLIGLFVVAVCFGSWPIWHFYQKFNSTTVEAATEKFQVTEEMRNELRLALDKSDLPADSKAIALWGIAHCQLVGEEPRRVTYEYWEVTRTDMALVAERRGGQPGSVCLGVVVGTLSRTGAILIPNLVIYYAGGGVDYLRIAPNGVYEGSSGFWHMWEEKNVPPEVKRTIKDIVTPTE